MNIQAIFIVLGVFACLSVLLIATVRKSDKKRLALLNSVEDAFRDLNARYPSLNVYPESQVRLVMEREHDLLEKFPQVKERLERLCVQRRDAENFARRISDRISKRSAEQRSLSMND